MPITIGQHLKQAREERYLTLEKASEETRIRTVFLAALEADDFSVMPSAAQGRGFLRIYADYLNINIDEVIAELQRHAPAPEEISGPLPQVNLVESKVPPLTESAEERKPARSLTSWLARFKKAESPSAAEPTGQTSTPVVEVETPGSVETQSAHPTEDLDGGVREELTAEVKPGLIARLASWFRLRVTGSKTDVKPELEDERGPAREAESKEPLQAESAGVIFAEIGKKLRERRELIGLTIDEVERHTRMRASLVRALEEGALDKLPSPVQTRGMLASYAAFLDLDPDLILLRFADALQARHREKYSQTPREKIQTEVIASIPILRGFIAGDLIFGILMISLILALSVWGISQVVNSQEQESAQATAPSIVDVLAGAPLPTTTPETTFVPVDEAPLATNAFGLNTLEGPTQGANINVVLGIFAVERTFVRVSVDGEVLFEGRIAPRETQVYEAENQVEVLTGNAAALRITYNGRDLGLMGNIGEVSSRVYTIAGIVTPTSTVPPTPTETKFVTSTPTATPSRTPTPENTATP